jgi:hypothetical protein
MSAYRLINTPRLEAIAWKCFRELEIEYMDVFSSDIYGLVSWFIGRQGYSCSTINSLGQSLTAMHRREEFVKQVCVALSPTDMNYRLAVFAIVNQLRELVGVKERFGSLEVLGFVFLGRYRRNTNELPLTPEQVANPKEHNRTVDLWGRTRDRAVIVRWSDGSMRVDRYVAGDSHVGEARRRLLLHERAVAA